MTPQMATRAELRRAWLAGYERGCQSGEAAGYRAALKAFLSMIRDVQTLRPSRGIAHSEMERRRATYSRPALTAQEIAQRARASWGLNGGGQSEGRRTA